MLDISLYGILDPAHCLGRPLPDLALQAIKGGVTLLQYRDKTADTAMRCERAAAIVEAISGSGVGLIVNDDVEAALASRAAGVHLGRGDADPELARAMLGEQRIIGLTVTTEEDARAVRVDLADYIFIGSVFGTTSKDNAGRIGVNGWRSRAEILRQRAPAMPIGAIAGITADNMADIIAAGADGVSVISAIFMQPDVTAAARLLADRMEQARAQR